jgi:hypothetical protein
MAEWEAAIAKHFGDWDANKNSALDESELAEGLGKLLTQGFPRFEEVTPPASGDKPPIKK